MAGGEIKAPYRARGNFAGKIHRRAEDEVSERI